MLEYGKSKGRAVNYRVGDIGVFIGTPSGKRFRFKFRAVPIDSGLVGVVRLVGRVETARIANICEGFSQQDGQVAIGDAPFFYGSMADFERHFLYSPDLSKFLDREEPENSRQAGGIYRVPLSSVQMPKRVRGLYDEMHVTLVDLLPLALEEAERRGTRGKPQAVASTRQSFRRYPLFLEELAVNAGAYYSCEQVR